MLLRLGRKTSIVSFGKVLSDVQLPRLRAPRLYDMQTQHDRTNVIAEATLPEALSKNNIPLSVPADGHCLHHSVHRLVSGEYLTPGISDPIALWRIRIAKEMFENSEDYLSCSFLDRGLSAGVNVCNTVLRFISYTDMFQKEHYNMSKFSGEEGAANRRLVFEREIMGQMKGYCGLWTLAALACVLDRPVRSIFPAYTDTSLVADYNRVFLPRTQKGKGRDPVLLLWTTNQASKGVVDHFAPVVRK